ncbi:hypothetical protein ACIRBY_37325 [Streptomyces sp. NPDC096136]|uniref:hypothetical protein n=1 Tax=Streptomyces sp. NPDC096136 TaxID=3366076 RepID=UPI00380488FD
MQRVRDPANVAAHWAARSHPRPDAVWDEWDGPAGVALLPAGREWDAVALTYRRVQELAEVDPQLLRHAAILADLTAWRAYLFIQAGAAATWDVPGTTPLGAPCLLVASKPGERQHPLGTWVQHPGPRNPLVDAGRLRAALLRTVEVQP